MYKYKLSLAYDGTRYGGWQVQTNTLSIQALVQKALITALREPVDLTGAGRTDAGVHALRQTAHFSSSRSVDTKRLLASLAALLPGDVRVLEIEEAAEDFHARYSATGKIYAYHLQLEQPLDPFRRLYSLHFPFRCDLQKLKEAAAHFVGTHDFSSFANEASRGSAAKDAVRTIRRLDVIDQPGGIRLEFEGDGFLYKMVRNIVGTLLDVATGKIAPESIPEILAAKDRRLAGRSAPAHGLFLVDVIYERAKDKKERDENGLKRTETDARTKNW